MTSTLFQECIDIVKGLVDNDYLYFDSSIEIKTSPHSVPFAAWAVCVSPKDELYLMDAEGQWHQVEISDSRAAMVIGSLYQRLRLMRAPYAQAS